MDNKALAKIRELVRQNKAEIKGKQDVDDPAVPRRDHNGKDIGDSGSHHKQFMKVASESASETQEDPEVNQTKVKAKTPRAQAKPDASQALKPGGNKKDAQIVLNPPEDQYDNNAFFKDGRNTGMREEYLAWLGENKHVLKGMKLGKVMAKGEVTRANDNAASDRGMAFKLPKNAGPDHHEVNQWMNHPHHGMHRQDGSSMTATSAYEAYCNHCDHHEKEPLALPTFGRALGDHDVQKSKIAGRVRYIGVALHSK